MTPELNPDVLNSRSAFNAQDHFRGSWILVKRFLRTYCFLILAVFLATVATAYVGSSFLSDRYDTTAKLIVRLGRQHLEPPPTVRSTGSLFSNGLRREDIASEIQILRSPDLAVAVVDAIGPEQFKPQYVRPDGFIAIVKFEAKQVIRRAKEMINDLQIALGLAKRLTDREQAILWLLSSVLIEPERDSDVIVAQIRTPDPGLGVLILEKWIDLYMQRRQAVTRVTGVNEFLEQELLEARERLGRAEARKLDWKRSQSLTSAEEQTALLLRQIRELDAEQNLTERQKESIAREIETSQSLVAQAKHDLATRRQESPNPVLLQLKEELGRLQLEHSKLLTKFTPQSIPLQDIEEQIERVSKLINQEKTVQAFATYEINPVVTDLERKKHEDRVRLAGLQAKAALQAEQRRKLDTELRSVDDADARLVEIERERQIAEQEYISLVQRKREADAARELDLRHISNVNVLTPPTSSIKPVFPNRLLIMGISILLGLLLGLGISAGLEYMDDRVRYPDRLAEATGLTFLARFSPERPLVTGSQQL
ncbi:MAG: GumC family protein [Bryobacteraceae bacterium]